MLRLFRGETPPAPPVELVLGNRVLLYELDAFYGENGRFAVVDRKVVAIAGEHIKLDKPIKNHGQWVKKEDVIDVVSEALEDVSCPGE